MPFSLLVPVEQKAAQMSCVVLIYAIAIIVLVSCDGGGKSTIMSLPTYIRNLGEGGIQFFHFNICVKLINKLNLNNTQLDI